MVIHQFNKLIRNKWLWGAFAVAISAFFAFDFLIDDIGRAPEQESAGAGTLAGEAVDAKLFSALVDEIRGFGRQRDDRRNPGEVNRLAWENYAALKVAGQNGLEATDAEVQAMIRNDPSFQQNGGFSFALYQALLRQNGLTPERFEAYLKRRVTLMRIGQAVLASATWASPMELDQAIADMTDTFTVKVAKFAQEKKDADAVKVDDAALKKWYEDNKKSLELPERTKIRFVKYNATDPIVLAKMTVTEDEMRDRYDVTVDKYTSTDTNGVETVKKFEEVKAGIEKELRQIAAVQYFETNLNARAYGVKSVSNGSRLDEIAKEDGVKVETSDWFSVEGGYQDGFMKRASQICPGAQGFAEAVAELDAESEDLRYGVVSSDKAVWLIEKKDVSAKELDAIIASVALQVPSTYQLESYVINSGNVITATCHIMLKKGDAVMESVCVGDGPIDAAFLAIEKVIGRHYELDDFQIQSVTEGREAMGETVVRLRFEGKIYSGRGISTDIVGSSIDAYLNAVN